MNKKAIVQIKEVYKILSEVLHFLYYLLHTMVVFVGYSIHISESKR